jgi:hypothetical protein
MVENFRVDPRDTELKSVLKDIEKLKIALVATGKFDEESDIYSMPTNPFRQGVHRHLKSHEAILSIIHELTPQFFNLVRAPKSDPDLREMLTSILLRSFEYLKMFVTGNPTNQEFLIGRTQLFNMTMPFNFNQIEFLVEICKDNYSVVEKNADTILGLFQKYVVQFGRNSIFTKLLEILMVAEYKPSANNVAKILNMLTNSDNSVPHMDYSTMIYANFTRGSFEFNFDTIKRKASALWNIDRDSEIYPKMDQPYYYHVKLLKVMTKCVEILKKSGKCRRLITPQYLISILCENDDYLDFQTEKDKHEKMLQETLKKMKGMGGGEQADLMKERERTHRKGLIILKPAICLYLKKVILNREDGNLKTSKIGQELFNFEAERMFQTMTDDWFIEIPVRCESDLECEFDHYYADTDHLQKRRWINFSYASYLFFHLLPMVAQYMDSRFAN